MNHCPSRIAGAGLLLLVMALLGDVAGGGASAASVAGVRLEPSAFRIDWSDGPYPVRVELSDLEHHGTISYDDNRDTVPDRRVPSEGLAAFEFVLHFNPDVLEVAQVQAGDFIGGADRTAQCFQRIPEPGQYAFGCASTGSAPGSQGSGTLATITLVPLASGTSLLGLEAGLAGPLGDDIAVTADGGVVEVFGAPETAPTPEPEPPQDVDATGTPVEPGDGESPDLPVPVGGGPVSSPGPTDGPDPESNQLAGGSLPPTGMADESSGAAGRSLALGGALAAGGLVLIIGSRLVAPSRRS